MPIDLSKIKSRKKDKAIVDPIELFQNLKVNDPNINDLWLAQGDALREWNQYRKELDIGIALNTGAGKTLVGLLIAQSLVNENNGFVLYACSSIQLVEQTDEKAKGYGLNVTTYYHGKYSNDLFKRGEAPCITTYQAIFNGKSVFFREEIDAIVFDDSHAAEHLLRDNFSLRLERKNFLESYTEIVSLFKEYYKTVGKSGSYSELDEASCQHLFLVPPFELQKQSSSLMNILTRAKLSENTDTTFSWEYLRDRIDLCCIIISGNAITITPPFIPVKSLHYFSNKTRRVYLSATLPSSDIFARTFGCVPDKIIAPVTSAGECERLIIIPSKLDIETEDTEIVKPLIEKYKVLILVPTYFRARKWQEIATPPEKEEVAGHVVSFRDYKGITKLLLAARYDGVDLPGDTCRVMVVDDLPMGVGPLERFYWEYLNLSNSFRTTIASRIVQSFGRISRGMSDHGIVILTGDRLVDWLLIPRNLSTLPTFLQKQLSLGFEISKQADTIEELEELIRKCLSRDKEWLDTYDDFIKNEEVTEKDNDIPRLTDVAKVESEFISHFWKREYDKAAKAISDNLETTFDVSNSTGGWHAMWLGRAYELLGELESANELYSRAHAAHNNIPALPSNTEKKLNFEYPKQVTEIDRQFRVTPEGKIYIPKTLHRDLAHLDGSGSSGQTEESLRALGQYFGFIANRPDKEFGTGPDVMWEIDENYFICLEVKTDKQKNSQYHKKELGQLSDHIQWIKNKQHGETIIPIFVGPLSGATASSNPPDDFKVVELEEFEKLSTRLTETLQDVADNSLHIDLRQNIMKYFKERDLLWPDCFDSINSHFLCEL